MARKDQRGPQEGHGGADAAVVTGSLRFVDHGGATNTSPVAAREAVAAGPAATASLRSGGTPFDVPPLAPTAAYFVARQPGSRGPATTRSLGPDRRPRA